MQYVILIKNKFQCQVIARIKRQKNKLTGGGAIKLEKYSRV